MGDAPEILERRLVMGSVDENLEVIRRIDQAWNARDWTTFGQLHAKDVFVRFTVPEGVVGRVAHIEEAENFLTAFPDHQIHFPYLKLFGQGDTICSVHQSSGTHAGPWALPDGRIIQPTGRRMEVEMVTVAKVLNGELVEETLYYDTLRLMMQLGLAPIIKGEAKAA
jgi:ketosteroid isomerase-like protein